THFGFDDYGSSSRAQGASHRYTSIDHPTIPTSTRALRGGIMSDIVQKLWGFCHTLRHDGIDYGDYIEQITYLLFLKMADERGMADLGRVEYRNEKGEKVKTDCSWPTLHSKSGTGLTEHYADVLRALGKQPGILGDIYAAAQSRFNKPPHLTRLTDLTDQTERTALTVNVKAPAYGGPLEKAASDGKAG